MKSIELTEKQFEGQVKDLAKLYGWRYYHTWRSIHSPAGFPDCVMVRDSYVIFAELKVGNNQPSIEQYLWLEALARAGQDVCLWYPSDFDEIVSWLKW